MYKPRPAPLTFYYGRYVGALPIALGVRSTNVYEDRSIALYEQELNDNESEEGEGPEKLSAMFFRPGSGVPRAKIWGEYTVIPSLRFPLHAGC